MDARHLRRRERGGSLPTYARELEQEEAAATAHARRRERQVDRSHAAILEVNVAMQGAPVVVFAE